MRTVVLGYGNRSRTDDGVGWFVVDRLQELALPDVELSTSHQLEVDHAELISRFDAVVFVDAAIPQSPVPITRSVVTPHLQGHAVAHYLTPGDVLELALTLFGRAPQAVLFSIRGADFNFGTTLSPATERAAHDVVRQIQQLVPVLQQHESGQEGVVARA
jgi:hydrogenase maturation protease